MVVYSLLKPKYTSFKSVLKNISAKYTEISKNAKSTIWSRVEVIYTEIFFIR